LIFIILFLNNLLICKNAKGQNYRYHHFLDYANFGSGEFNAWDDYPIIKFDSSADFSFAEFESIADFSGTKFHSKVIFNITLKAFISFLNICLFFVFSNRKRLYKKLKQI